MKSIATICFGWLMLATLPLSAQPVVSFADADTASRVSIPTTATSVKFVNYNQARSYTLMVINNATGQQTDGITNADIQIPANGVVTINKLPNGQRQLFGTNLPANAALRVRAAGGAAPPPPVATPDSIELIPFNDAVRLKKLLALPIADANKGKVKSYLLKYFGKEDSPAELSGLIDANSYLKQAGVTTSLLSVNTDMTLLEQGASLDEASAKSAGSQGGFGLSPTAVADALGTFIAKRFKDEINVAFVKRFRTLLAQRPDSPRLLFPETANVLLNNDPYNYTAFLETLQESFQQDLEALPPHVIDYAIVNRSRIQATAKFNDADFDATLAALQVVSALRDDKAVPQVLGQFGTSKAVLAMKTPALQGTFQIISMLARNGTTDETGETFLTKEQVKELADEKLLNLFLGLMLAKEKSLLDTINLPVVTGTGSSTTLINASLYTVINSLNTKLPDFRKTIGAIYNGITAMKGVKESIINELNSNKQKPSIAPLYLDLLSKGIGVLQQGVTLYTSLTAVAHIPAIPNGFNAVFSTAQLCIPVVQNLVTKQYGVALTHSVILLQKLFEIKPTPTAMTATQTVQYNALNATLGDGRPGGSGLVGDLMRYGSFMVTVVKAENKEEMLQALESAALPVGSYRIKRNNFFTVSINSFGGAYAGLRTGQGMLAPSAPVGIYAGWGTDQVKVRQRDYSANGFFVTLLDVGAVAAFRLNDQTSAIPEVTWQNFISPGLYFVHGFCNVLSLGFGVQYGPQLTAIKDGMNITEPKAWRVGIKFTADIPIFNLHTKANRKSLAEQ